MSQYTREILKVVVAKICQTIGWHSIQSTSLEIMVDILRRYLAELTKLTHAYSVQFGHTQPNLDELGLAFRDMHISIADLEEYVRYVDSVVPLDVPQFPSHKESHLNFLKPGSSEVVTRPVHIHEHLPPMLPTNPEVEANGNVNLNPEESPPTQNGSTNQVVFKRPADVSPNEVGNKRPRLIMEEEGRPTREISSVMMTTSGFLSPAREGKLPEARTPSNAIIDIPVVNGSQYPTSPTGETRFDRKTPKPVRDIKKVDKRKEKANKELFKCDDDVTVKKNASPKNAAKIKAMKANAAVNHNANINNHVNNSPVPNDTVGKTTNNNKSSSTVANKQKVHSKTVKSEKVFNNASPTTKLPLSNEKVVDGKLLSEPDKLKLNIFKKISKVKDEKSEKLKLKEEQILQESRENLLDLVMDEPDFKYLDRTKPMAAKQMDLLLKHEQSDKFMKTSVLDVDNKMYDLIKSPQSEKDFLYDDDISPPGTPSTPKTPEMLPHSPPTKTEKDLKRKRKEKNKIKNKTKVPRHTMSPRRNKCDNFETEFDRPKTPNDPIPLIKEENIPMMTNPVSSSLNMGPQTPVPPVFSFFPGFIPGPGLIPAPIPNSLFPRLPMSANIPKHGFGQPAHIPPAMPTLPFMSPSILSAAPAKITNEVIEQPSHTTTEQQPAKQELIASPGIGIKEKHKKDKKDKLKKKNKKDKTKNKSEKKKLREEKKEKDKVKKEKKEKKKDKDKEHEGSVPKLTLKIGSPRPSTPDVHVARKIMIKPVVKREDEVLTTPQENVESAVKREPSPELARISALITRPPKLKTSKDLHGAKEESGGTQPSATSTKQTRSRQNIAGNKESPVTTSLTHAGVKTIAGKQKPLVKQKRSSVVDDDGNKVWICPACGNQDDGSPMIGCDDCDAWYHWVCVGIQVPPDDNEDWYCRICIVKKEESRQLDKKRKRKRKERKEH